MPHPLSTAETHVRRLKQPTYLLTQVDEVAPKPTVLQFAAVEVAEVIGALEEGISENEVAQEVADVLVFYFSWMFVHAPQVDSLGSKNNVNGYGRHDTALEGLIPVILESEYDPRAISEVLGRIWSLALWNPYAMQGLHVMDQVIAKVQANYPQELFSVFDPTMNRDSLPEEVMPRYLHMKAGLRLIRNVVRRTLKPADWQPHVYLLQSWQEGAWALDELQKILVINEGVR